MVFVCLFLVIIAMVIGFLDDLEIQRHFKNCGIVEYSIFVVVDICGVFEFFYLVVKSLKVNCR